MSANVPHSEDGLSDAIASLRADHSALNQRVGGLEKNLEDKHRENRISIHRLSDGQQSLIEMMRVGFDKIADKIGERIGGVEEDVIDLRLKWAKATGYAVGVSALGAVVFEGVKTWIEHASK